MGFFDRLAEWLMPSPTPIAPTAQPPAPQAPPEPEFPPVPAELPKIFAKTAAELCKECKPEPPAVELLSPQQTPAQFLAVLQERNMGSDMVKVLAQGLPDREGVAWAVQSALKVADKLPVADAQALQAAQAWAKDPSPERQAAAAAAAKRTDYQGPGAWAAQAAASAQAGGPAPAAPGGVEAPRLTPHAVSGSVLLSASILGVPEYAARLRSAMVAAAGAAAGMAVAGASIPQFSGASAHLRVPTLG
ncbi:MAG: hypothetical protein ABI318_24395, partial [Chthoniobacteraceae bacterium]